MFSFYKSRNFNINFKPCVGHTLFVFKFATPVAERLGALFLNLSIISPLGSSLALATCETRQVLLVGVPGVFLGVLPLAPTY